MTQDSFGPHGSLPAGDRALRGLCERLRQLATKIAEGNPAVAITEEAAALRLEIEPLMLAHHRHEEALLFPALLEAMAGSDAVCLRELTEFLAAEHRALEESWQHVCRVLVSIEAGEREAAGLSKSLEAFADRYLRHIQREEEELFPMAARLLTEEELAQIEQKLHAVGGN